MRGDLRRAMMRDDFNLNAITAKDIMTRSPVTAPAHIMLSEAEALMREHQIKQLLVVDEQTRPVGIIDFYH